MASFTTRNDDVFWLAGDEVAPSGNLRYSETRASDAKPVRMRIEYRTTGSTGLDVSLQWLSLSERQIARGDMVSFNLVISGGAGIQERDTLVLIFPIMPSAFADPDFATIGSCAMRASGAAALRGAELCFGTDTGLQFGRPIRIAAISHLATAHRFTGHPVEAFLEIRLHLLAFEGNASLRFGRIFAGLDFDPYVFNPLFERIAHFGERPIFAFEEETKAEFVRQARAACRQHNFRGMQAFIHPFIVRREGNPTFPMLVGTPNSMSWYAENPSHHIESYTADEFVRTGDVVLDCGAHAGQMSTLFALLAGPRGWVHAFDPFPQNCLQTESQARLNELGNLSVHQRGIGAGRATLNLSILGQATVNMRGAENDPDRIEVDIVPLDDYMDARPNVIKLDIEGAEVGALLGGQRLLRRCRPRIFVELHTQFLGAFGHTVADFFDAIPKDVYDVTYSVEGVDPKPVPWSPDAHERVTRPALVWAKPRD